MTQRNFLIAAGWLGMAAISVFGQQQPAPVQQSQAPPPLTLQQPVATGSVTGRVICSDTQHAARFAQVSIVPVETATGNSGGRGRGGTARTDLNGEFTATNIAPGDYYVNATATGYISGLTQMLAVGTDATTALSRLPTVHVVANSPSTVNVSIDRGGVIAGKVQWDDGTPAAGVDVSLINSNPPATSSSGGGAVRMIAGFGGGFGGQFGQTDDRGQFRISGIASGSYFIRVTLQAPVSGAPGVQFIRTTPITMYSPGKVRRSDAQAITVNAGEERADVTMMLDLSALHKLSGRVGALSGSVASGTVRLVDSQDSTLSRTATINADGTYELTYVPAGTYTLSVPYASSSANQQGRGPGGPGGGGGGGRNRGPTTSFQPFQETVSVTASDMTDVNITLLPATATSTQSSQ